jgi:hypothetical protein
MTPGDRVQFTLPYQRLLYSKNYEHALGWWSVLEVMEEDRVRVEPEGRKCIGFLVVPCSALTRPSQTAAVS